MTLSRRDLSLLFPVLAAARASAQGKDPLPPKVYHNGDIPYAGDDKKKAREFFHGVNHSGFGVEAHETILGPGIQSHAPHKHEHEELVVVFEGTIETFVEGKTELAEAGSVVYFASNRMHGMRNAGSTPCRYYVVELRGSEA